MYPPAATTDIATIARLFVIWPVVLVGILIAFSLAISVFIGINLLIFVGIPAALGFAWVRYKYGPQWFTRATRWVGTQLAAVSPADDLKAIDYSRQAIYSCHPHGLLAAAPYIHFTLLRQIPTMTTPFIVAAPIVRQVRTALRLIDSNKSTVDAHLAAGNSLTVVLGGAREAAATEPHAMRLCADRRGIFELSVKHRLPIVPVLTYGENEMFTVKLQWKGLLGRAQEWLYKRIHGVWAFPNLLEVWRWLRGDIVLHTHTAEEILPEPGESWESVRERYKAALEALYERTRPATYAPAIEWITRESPQSLPQTPRSPAAHHKLS